VGLINWIGGLLLACLLVFSPILGYLSSPWAAFWLKGDNTIPPPIIVEPVTAQSIDPGNLNLNAGALSDAQRFQLARLAGFSQQDAILATAISIAENGSGNPAAMSAINRNGTYDLGMWQINTIWWAQFGGRDALIDPWRNAQAAYYIKGRQGWCAWSTYGPGCQAHGCGPPCYLDFLGRAQRAAQVSAPAGQA
jgi:Lysozyme like domain